MPVADSAAGLVTRYLHDAIAAEHDFETQLRSFAQQGDDDEVQSAFLTYANQIRTHHDRLAQRLEQLGATPSNGKSVFAELDELAPKLSQAGNIAEERITQNLIAAFTIGTAECAMHEALATAAAVAGDAQTERLAREIQSEERQTADLIFRFIPSRSKIAFNVVTPHEIDPAIDTKAPDDRII
jgi:ferritin-like metal-binding protein YciE